MLLYYYFQGGQEKMLCSMTLCLFTLLLKGNAAWGAWEKSLK